MPGAPRTPAVPGGAAEGADDCARPRPPREQLCAPGSLPRGGAALSRPSRLQGCDFFFFFFFSFSKTRSPGRRGRFRGPAPRPFLLVGDGGEEVGRPGRRREQARESLSLHVTRRRGNPHSRPLTQMTIFGNVRQWNRPRALRPRGGGGVRRERGRPRRPRSARAALSHPPRLPPSSRGVCGWRQRDRERGREGSAPPAFSPPLPRLFLLLLVPGLLPRRLERSSQQGGV